MRARRDLNNPLSDPVSMPAESSDIVELKLESREDGGDVRSLWDAGETGGKDGLIPRFGVDVMGIGKTAPVEMKENIIYEHR